MFALTRKLMKADVAASGSAAGGLIVAYTGLRRTTGRADPGERLWVCGRSGRPCRRCGTPIAYRKVGPDARGIYFCFRCQR
jgi:endonuclease-8